MDIWTFRRARQWIQHEQTQTPALRIIEIGSYAVSTRWRYLGVPGHHRGLLRPSDSLYGVDAVDGPGVDLVADATALPITQGFDLGIASSVLEHVPDPPAVIAELLRVATRSLLIAPWVYPYHAVAGHYEDYWRVSPTGLRVWVDRAGGHCVETGWYGPHSWAIVEILRKIVRGRA